MRLRTPLALLGAAVLVLAGPPLLSSGDDSDSGTQIPGLRFMVPNTPGGGYDITARTAAKNAEDAGLTHNIEVFNLPGAGGTVGLSRLVSEHGNGKLAMSMGLGVVGAARSNHAPKTLADATPIARLTEEQDVVVVAKDSPYKTIGELIDAWKEDPGKIPVGGGSSPGGPDHLAPMLMAQAAGIQPKSVNYIPFDGGGELLASILGNKVGFGVSGVGEYLDQIKAGELRVLAVTGPERVDDLGRPRHGEAAVHAQGRVGQRRASRAWRAPSRRRRPRPRRTLVSMLTLGLPSHCAARRGDAGRLPAVPASSRGALLFEREPEPVCGLIASLFADMVLLLALNLPLAPVWAKLLRIPRPYLYAGIMFFAAVGAYAVGGEVVDLVILLVIGLIGFGMRRYGLPVLPAVIGVILGPNAEQQLRRALQISDGSVTGLVNTPFSVTVYAVIVLLLAWPLVKHLVVRGRTRADA
ncbi:hypothetical protein STENM327S_08982 [Streptomyces tendae]